MDILLKRKVTKKDQIVLLSKFETEASVPKFRSWTFK